MNSPSHHNFDHDILIAIREKVIQIDKCVSDIERNIFGNGQPGLFSRVERLERYKVIFGSGIAVLSAIAGALLYSLVG
jgi:hypothetical protein